MHLEFVGAARTVTGSKHLLRTPDATVLLDCGLFQGRRAEARAKNTTLDVDPAELDAVVLSHAHIDHCGALPFLVRRGYRGPIFATPATRDLCAALLADAAMLQAADARYVNARIVRDHADMEPIEPLYGVDDVRRTLEQFVGLPYHRVETVAPGVTVRFLDAGHVLGSAITVIDVPAEARRIAFSGDLGRRGSMLLREPEVPDGVDTLLLESTYGDRLHPPLEAMEGALQEVLRRTVARGGKVLVPAFALERAQEIVHALANLRRSGRMPPIPVYVDSPLTVKLTDVFRLHPDALRPDLGGAAAFDFEGLRYVSDVEDSKALDASDESAVIIAASGMCEGGRVVHHLRAMVEDDRHTVLMVGFQAQHTLGRRLVEQRARVRIFGVERDRRAEVVSLEGFSAHADQAELVRFARACRDRGPLERILLVHGEPAAQAALTGLLRRDVVDDVHAPEPHERVELGRTVCAPAHGVRPPAS